MDQISNACHMSLLWPTPLLWHTLLPHVPRHTGLQYALAPRLWIALYHKVCTPATTWNILLTVVSICDQLPGITIDPLIRTPCLHPLRPREVSTPALWVDIRWSLPHLPAVESWIQSQPCSLCDQIWGDHSLLFKKREPHLTRQSRSLPLCTLIRYEHNSYAIACPDVQHALSPPRAHRYVPLLSLSLSPLTHPLLVFLGLDAAAINCCTHISSRSLPHTMGWHLFPGSF